MLNCAGCNKPLIHIEDPSRYQSVHDADGRRLVERRPFCSSCSRRLRACPECGEKKCAALGVYCRCGLQVFPLRDYHSDASPKYKGDDKVRFGLEMEVNGEHPGMQKAMVAAGFTLKDVYAERDCTVDVEWVTRPLLEKEAPAFIRRAVTALREGGARIDSDSSCGCHHNVDKHALSEAGWGRVAIAMHVFRSALAKFSGYGRELDDYASEVSGVSQWCTPLGAFENLKEGGSHDCISWRKNRVVELRLPGMSLDPAEMVTQFKLYANLIRNMAPSKAAPRDFLKAFGPLDDEMLQVLAKKGLSSLAGAKAKARPRKGHWDLRCGDTVVLLSSEDILRYHGLPNGDPSNLGSPGDKYTVLEVCSGPGSEVLPANQRLVLEDEDGDRNEMDDSGPYVHQFRLAVSVDSSTPLKAPVSASAPVVLLPAQVPASSRALKQPRTSTSRRSR